MDAGRITTQSGQEHDIEVAEAGDPTPELVRTLLEIDLQTFAESTFSYYTAAALLEHGAVFLLRADARIIGTCVCIRTWERPTEALVLSMGIKPGWRGRGLGQTFMSGVVTRLAQRGLHAVVVVVGADNRRAVNVYEDVGFERVAETVPDPRTDEVFLTMRCRLREAHVTALPGERE